MSQINEKFDELKEKQMISFRISDLKFNNGWGDKSEFFQGDYEVYVNSDMIIVFDKINDKAFLIRDKDNEIIEFMRRFEDYIFNKLPATQINEKEFDVEFEGSKIHVTLYKNELGIDKTEINKVIRHFLYSNYIIKKDEQENFRIEIFKDKDIITVRGDTVKIKDLLKNLGFEWDKDRKVWKKKNSNGIDTIKKILEKI